MLCLFCEKKLRKTRKIDFVGREYHFGCIERMRKKKADQELEELLELIKSGLRRIEMDFGCNIITIN
jgi:hypothetical protein